MVGARLSFTRKVRRELIDLLQDTDPEAVELMRQVEESLGPLPEPKTESERHKQIRIKLVILLGGKCVCQLQNCWHAGECNIQDMRVVQIDHINGDGADDRKRFNGMTTLYGYYLKHPEEARQKLQALCLNCHWMKKLLTREFPYKCRPRN